MMQSCILASIINIDFNNEALKIEKGDIYMMTIRPETASDHERIGEITKAAFKNCVHEAHNEHKVIDALRSALILHGLEKIKELKAQGCVLVGEPGYYKRFGFKNNCEGLDCEGVPPKYVMALLFGNKWPSGKIFFHPGFFCSDSRTRTSYIRRILKS